MAGAPPLAVPHPGRLSPGDFVLIKYNVAEQLWHMRLLLAHVAAGSWVILTPQADLYIEDLGGSNNDISAWRVYDPSGPPPYGITASEIHAFRNLPDAAARGRLIEEGESHAQVERARLGLAPAGAAVTGVPDLAGQPGGVVNVAASAPVGGPAGGGGNAALAAALQGGVAAGGDVGVASGEDARTLGISRDDTGLRFKEFRSAVTECKAMEFKDWPIAGPRTTKHVIMQMLDHGGSAIGHHQSWRTACKFQPTDGPAMEHESWCKVLHTMLTYDQLDVSNLASAELVARAIQRIEEKHKWKLASADDAGEGALFMGSSSGSRAGSIVSPKLTEWIGTEMQKEAMVAKERRKAREERALSRKNGDKDPNK